MQRALCVLAVMVAGVSLLLSGCNGGGEFGTAPVTGKVVYQGQPVADAFVEFTPQPSGDKQMPGKAASGTTDAQGVFTLSTYETNDGAVVGKHRVNVNFGNPDKKLPGKVPADLVLEVKPGNNDLTIELQ